MNFSKIKDIYLSKDNENKKQTKKWDRYLQWIYLTQVSYLEYAKKNSYKSIQKAGSPIREMVLNKCVIQNIQMSNKHVENKFNFISYKDIHIKTTSHLLECV